jgi:uncharacterized protein YbjT (DUF2867 family)
MLTRRNDEFVNHLLWKKWALSLCRRIVMAEKKRILVTGATGAQGGSVARHLLRQGKLIVRCVTRHPDSEKASWLRSQGVEIFKGDMADQKSINVALEQCDYVYGVTNFWEHFDREYELGKNLVDAVTSKRDVEHFVLSTLPHVNKITNGKLPVPHFDMKAELEEYTRGLGIGATFVHIAFYFENFLSFFPPKKENGAWSFGFPQGDTPLAGVAVGDVGGVVAPVFDEPARFKGKTIVIAGDALPPARYAELMTEILGRKIEYRYVPREVFASFGFPGADDLANMFEYYRIYNPYGEKEISGSRALYPGLQDFETWLRGHAHAFHELFRKQESATPAPKK